MSFLMEDEEKMSVNLVTISYFDNAVPFNVNIYYMNLSLEL